MAPPPSVGKRAPAAPATGRIEFAEGLAKGAMNPLEFMLAAFGVSLAAGLFGAVLGLGGGTVVVPALTLLLGIDIRYAIGASIVSVEATSSGAGAAFVRQRLTNIRVSMLLETATTTGAVGGAVLAGVVAGRWLFLLFGALLALSALEMWRRPRHLPPARVPPDRLAERLALCGAYHDDAAGRDVRYRASHTPWGLAASACAGLVSGLLGIGGGVVKVPTMNLVMHMPFKAASATSNFMIGVTAAASAGVYFYRGDVNPYIAAPVALGVLVGAFVGARVMERARSSLLRAAFTVVLVAIAAQMVWKGLH